MTRILNFINSVKKKKRQKGVTFLEILAVLVILVLIYLAYARSFGQGTDKARLSDVQNTFKQFQLGYEDYLNENSGVVMATGTANNFATDPNALNNYLQADYKINGPTVGDITGAGVQPATNPVQNDLYSDPWKTPFKVQVRQTSATHWLIGVRSYGKDKSTVTANDIFNYSGAGADADDILLVSDYNNGIVKSCTKGLSKDLGNMTPATGEITGCN